MKYKSKLEYDALISLPDSFMPITPNLKVVRAQIVTDGTGYNDFYTCPEGKRAHIAHVGILNRTATLLPVSFALKVSGNYYRLTTDFSIGAGNWQQDKPAIILEGGESMAIYCTSADFNVYTFIHEFDVEGSNVRTVKYLNLPSGETMVYECPEGYNAVVDCNTVLQSGLTGNFHTNVISEGGVSRAYNFNLVPKGDIVDVTNRLNNPQTATADARTSVIIPIGFNSGDKLYITLNTNTNPIWAYFNIQEYKNP